MIAAMPKLSQFRDALAGIMLIIAMLSASAVAAPIYEDVEPELRRHMLVVCAPAIALCKHVGDREGPMEQLTDNAQMDIGVMCGRSLSAASSLRRTDPSTYRATVQFSAEQMLRFQGYDQNAHQALLKRCITFWQAN